MWTPNFYDSVLEEKASQLHRKVVCPLCTWIALTTCQRAGWNSSSTSTSRLYEEVRVSAVQEGRPRSNAGLLMALCCLNSCLAAPCHVARFIPRVVWSISVCYHQVFGCLCRQLRALLSVALPVKLGSSIGALGRTAH